jgi:hypothetical protein
MHVQRCAKKKRRVHNVLMSLSSLIEGHAALHREVYHHRQGEWRGNPCGTVRSLLLCCLTMTSVATL